MREITPINIWSNGQTVQATQLQLYCINDNLINSASFYYALLDANSIMLTQGNLSMVSPDYETDWNTNNQAWNWAATQLNLTLLPVTTTTTTTETTTETSTTTTTTII